MFDHNTCIYRWNPADCWETLVSRLLVNSLLSLTQLLQNNEVIDRNFVNFNRIPMFNTISNSTGVNGYKNNCTPTSYAMYKTAIEFSL